jgi:hypothetical protein
MDNSKINHVNKIFVSLKQESYVSGKNLASMNNLAKKSKTSRNNFYEQAEKSEEWKKLVKNIQDFKIEFNDFLNLKSKPSIEQKKINQLSEKSKILLEQNLELIDEINNLFEQLKEKDSIIKNLENRIQIQMKINYNGDINDK